MVLYILILISCICCAYSQSTTTTTRTSINNNNHINPDLNTNPNKELDIITNKINGLGLPYYMHDANMTKNNELKLELQNSIVVIAHEIVKSIDWEDVVQNIDFLPNFDLSLEGIDSSQSLSLLQATMFSFTASTDMIIAISNIPELRMIMNASNPNPHYSSIQYIRNYLIEQDDNKFQLKRFEVAMDQLMNQAIERVSNSRKVFIKQISEFVEGLHDCFKVKENIEYDANDEPIPVENKNKTYRIVGPTAREINTQISKLVTSYIYMPLVVGSYESTLFYHIPQLSIEDAHEKQRKVLLAEYSRIETKLSKAVKKSKPQRVKEYAAVIKAEVDILYEFYSQTGGDKWTHSTNWFNFPTTSKIETETDESEKKKQIGSIKVAAYTYEAIHLYIKKHILNCKTLQGDTHPCITDETLELQAVYHVFFENWYGLVLSNDPLSPGFIEIKLHHNNMIGILPNNILQLSNSSLIALDISNNKLNNDFSNPKQQIDLSKNKHLSIINFANNLFSGKLPSSVYRTISNFDTKTELMHLDISHNKLTGTLSANIAKCTHLQVIKLNNNKMMGTIPKSIEKLIELQQLDISYNKFTNTIPTQLLTLTTLEMCSINDNKFTGTLSNRFITKCKSLLEFNIQNNRFHGTLPLPSSSSSSSSSSTSENGNGNTAIQRINMGYNQFTGTIPTSIMSLTHLTYLDIGYNKLTGTLPEIAEQIEFKYYGNNDLE